MGDLSCSFLGLILASVLSQENNTPASEFPPQHLIRVFVIPPPGLHSSSLAGQQGGEIIKSLLPLTGEHCGELLSWETANEYLQFNVTCDFSLRGLHSLGSTFISSLALTTFLSIFIWCPSSHWTSALVFGERPSFFPWDGPQSRQLVNLLCYIVYILKHTILNIFS